mmetsp:Transcript_38007/g.65949  ORF Transcript_38007/g.65949 Transcript_38007/m.65949 type:complete len:328 (+) Transcript_38007:102-1085(+)
MCNYFYPPKKAVSQPSVLDRTKGALMHLVFIGCWVGGVNTPLIFGLLIWRGTLVSYVFAALILFVAIFPFILKPGKWPAFKYTIPEWGQRYHKECNIIFVEGAPFDEDLHKLQRHAFCYHPHGVLSWGFVLNAGFRHFFEPLFGVVADALCYAPLWYWFVTRWTKAVRPASKKHMTRYMEKGESFGIIPGGFEEATISKLGAQRVYLKKRKGFVKYALKYGYALVPVYTFGESDTYYNVQGAWRLRLWLNSLQLPGVLPFGAWWCPIMPKQVRLTTVVGKPLQLPQISSPSQTDVNKWHEEYVKALLEVFEQNKSQCGYPDAEMELW